MMQAQLVGARERALSLIEEITSDADNIQRTLLSEILGQNSNTEYLRGLFLARPIAGNNGDPLADSIIQPHAFKLIAPLTRYEDIQSYIQRIADGDHSSPLLTDSPVRELLQSSGTSSGLRKLYPAIEADADRRKLTGFFAESVVRRNIEGLDEGKETIFHFLTPTIFTKGGVPSQSMSASSFKDPVYKQYLEARSTSPVEVVLGIEEDVRQGTYCQLLCSLLHRQEVVRLGAVYASGFLHVMHVLKSKWRELVQDIRTGSLNETEVSDPSVRKAVEKQMEGPNPLLAMQVEEECCCQPLWQGIIPRLWSRAKCVTCIVTGSMEQYIPMLEFLSGGLPLVSSIYIASEGVFGINMNPLCSPYDVSYTILPNTAYYEFLPLDDTKDSDDENSVHQSQLVDLVNVKLGQKYEVVITTFAGLYRYRVGDRLRVTGFYNKTPQFCIEGRKNVVLSIDTDKTDDTTLHKAVQAAKIRHLESGSDWLQLMDYTSCTDVSTLPAHYVLFWELSCKAVSEAREALLSLDPTVMEACCDTIEECLDAMYKRGKGRNWIGPLEIRVVRQGTFYALMEYSHVARGVPVNQYKTPRVVKLAPLLDLLNSRVSHSFFATGKAT